MRAGLWEHEARLSSFERIDYKEFYRLAEEQSVDGLMAAGLEHVVDVKVPGEDILNIVGSALQLEQLNQKMNAFIGVLVEKMRKAGIETLLVKGQGIAQCYERPLWRAPGDVDLYLSEKNYQAAKKFLMPLASDVEKENQKRLHLGMTLDSWVVELHGSMHSDYSDRVNKGLDEVHLRVFTQGETRVWNNNGVKVYLPSADNDVIIIFSHILQHFFVEGIGLRQICDWCRLVYTYRDTIDVELLEKRLRSMGLMDKWKAFAALTVEYLGMPKEAMPFYDASKCWRRKGQRIMALIMDTGTFGYNRDMGYKEKDAFVVRLAKSFKRRTKDGVRQFIVFPQDALRMWWKMVKLGVSVATRGV